VAKFMSLFTASRVAADLLDEARSKDLQATHTDFYREENKKQVEGVTNLGISVAQTLSLKSEIGGAYLRVSFRQVSGPEIMEYTDHSARSQKSKQKYVRYQLEVYINSSGGELSPSKALVWAETLEKLARVAARVTAQLEAWEIIRPATWAGRDFEHGQRNGQEL
jgi:hypothetical protein